MELLQNMSALPGQGMTNATASVASRTIPASTDDIDLPAGTAPDSVAQDGSKGAAEFGNVLNIILGLTPAPENMGNKTSAITDFPNIFTNPAPTVLTQTVLANISSSVLSAEEAVLKNGQASQSNLPSSSIQTALPGIEKKSDTAGLDIATDAKSGIIYPNINIFPASENTTITNKPSDANAEKIEISSSMPAQTASSNTQINNFQASRENQADWMHTSVANKTASMTDKLLNSAAIISAPVTETTPANTVAVARENLQAYTPITPKAGDNSLHNEADETISVILPNTTVPVNAPIEDSIEAQQVVANQAPIAMQGASDTKTADQKTAPKKKTEISANTIDTVASQQPLDPQIPAEAVTAPEPQPDSPRQDLTPTSPRENSTPRHGANPAASTAAPQVLPAGQLAAPLDVKPAADSNISAETQQARQQDKSPIQPFRDSNADRGAVSPAAPSAAAPVQTQNITSQPQTVVDGQNFTQTLAQASDGNLVAAPDGSQQSAGTEVAQGETGNIILMDKPDSLRATATPALPRAETQPQHVSPPIRDIAIHISQHADTGANRFQLRLDPPELGRVDVRMEISAEGKLSAVIAVERPETLDLLQRDSRALERSLMEAGLKTDSNSLSFSLKGGRQDHQHAGLANNGSDRGSNPLSDDWDDTVAPIAARFANRAVNIHI